MIIGIDISSIPYGTGVSNYTLNLVRSLLMLDKTNHYKLFYSSARLPLSHDVIKLVAHHHNCQLYQYKIPQKILSLMWNQLHLGPIEWFIGKCDIFHSSDWTQPPTTNASCISTIHDLTPFIFPQWLDKTIITNHQQKMNFAIKQHSFFLCVSHTTQKDLIKKFPNIPQSQSAVIYEAAEDKYFEFFKLKNDHKEQLLNSIKNKYHLHDYLLAQGTREPRKNLIRIINAFNKFKQLHPKSTLQLVISGKYGWGQDVTPSPDIKVIGFVDENDLVQLHAAALALIYPSLYEGFGLPVIKAMAVGTPVITSNNSSLLEIGTGAAILVTPTATIQITNAIGNILKTTTRRKLIKAGLARAKSFSWHKTAENTLKIYQKVYANRH